MSEFNQARREGKIKFGYDYSSVAEVTHLWGLKATKLPYRVCFRIPGRENALCCLLSEAGGNGWKNIPHYGIKTDGRGWHEILRIDESNDDEMASAQRVHDELANPQERYVFWRESREGAQWYKFFGVYEIDQVATRAAAEDGEVVCVMVEDSVGRGGAVHQKGKGRVPAEMRMGCGDPDGGDDLAVAV